jgi:hypothetical protein
VFVSLNIGSAKIIPAMDSNTPATNMKIKKEEKAFCTLSNSFAPKNCEITTDVPLPIPITSEIIK